MRLHRTTRGIFVEQQGCFYSMGRRDWDELLCGPDLMDQARAATSGTASAEFRISELLAPVQGQEVWAAGVTYYRSRNARMDESKDAGGGDFYDRVYSAKRPELFFKSTGERVVGPGNPVRIRSDARWSVPEPELTLVIDSVGSIIGYTIGNDMSSRDIEGENPLYLPQAKIYDGSCAIGPCVLLVSEPLPQHTAIRLEIQRDGDTAFCARITLAELKRDPKDLVSYLYRDTSFPKGALLMTGTGIVPEDDFSLVRGDVIHISIDGIGTLTNYVA